MVYLTHLVRHQTDLATYGDNLCSMYALKSLRWAHLLVRCTGYAEAEAEGKQALDEHTTPRTVLPAALMRLSMYHGC